MGEAVIFGMTMFIGWVIFDFVKHKKLTFELVTGAFVVGVIAAVGWFILDIIFP